jgi:exosortase
MGLLAVLVAVAYAYTWYWLYVRWTAPDSFFAHGFLVPLISIWLVFRRKERLQALDPASDFRGLLLVIPALLLHVMAIQVEVYSPSGFTLPVLLAGLVLYFGGFRFLKVLLFPIAYLFFAIPLPMNWVHAMSFQLKIVAVNMSCGLSGLLGAEIRDDGSFILFESGEHLLVGSPCSGLRSLVALLALGVLYAVEFTRLNTMGRLVFIALAVPIAMVSNILRITFLCMLADTMGVPATTGAVHDLSGYGIYLVALVLMAASGRLLQAVPVLKRRAA